LAAEIVAIQIMPFTWLLVRSLAVGAVLLAAASSAGGATSVDPGLMAYFGNAPPCAFDRSRQEVACNDGIWTAKLDGTQPRQLTRKLEVGVPSWSRDGRRIAYMAGTGRRGLGEVWVMGADGGGKRRLAIPEPFYPQIVNGDTVSWTHDGKALLVAATRLDRKKQKTISTPVVLTVPVNGDAPQALFTLPRGRDFAGVFSPQLSPNGKRLAFMYRRDLSQGLYVANPDGSGRRRLATASLDQGRKLDWSPDGKRIVFAQRVNIDGSLNPELFVVNADGTGLRRVTHLDGTNNDLTPSWSPNGRQILFNATGLGAGEENHEHRFAVVNLDGSGLHLVGPGRSDCVYKAVPTDKWCYASDPDWSPR
jgi:Tol biopolymer transport system component